MGQELVSRIAATAKSNLQLPDEQLPTIERYVKRAINRILVFCGRRTSLPRWRMWRRRLWRICSGPTRWPHRRTMCQRHTGRHQHQLPGQGQQPEGDSGFCEEL